MIEEKERYNEQQAMSTEHLQTPPQYHSSFMTTQQRRIKE